MAPANPPIEPTTSGRCVDSTAERMSSTARSPAATSTPARTYASRGAEPFEAASAMRREWLFEHELPARGVVRHGLGVAPIEAGEAEPLIGQLERAQDALDREIAERIGADELADLLDRARRRDQLGGDLGVDAVEARVVDRGGADPDVDLGGAGLPQQRHDLLGRGAADDRVVDDGEAPSLDHGPDRVELHRHATVAERLRGLDEAPTRVAVPHEALAIRDTRG